MKAVVLSLLWTNNGQQSASRFSLHPSSTAHRAQCWNINDAISACWINGWKPSLCLSLIGECEWGSAPPPQLSSPSSSSLDEASNLLGQWILWAPFPHPLISISAVEEKVQWGGWSERERKLQLTVSWNNPFFQGSSKNSSSNHLICAAYLTLKSILWT